MFFLFMLLVLGTLLFFLARHGHFGSPSLISNPSPEADAKKILAERFARGVDPESVVPGIEYAKGLSSTDKSDPLHGFECERMTQGIAALIAIGGAMMIMPPCSIWLSPPTRASCSGGTISDVEA